MVFACINREPFSFFFSMFSMLKFCLRLLTGASRELPMDSKIPHFRLGIRLSPTNRACLISFKGTRGERNVAVSTHIFACPRSVQLLRSLI